MQSSLPQTETNNWSTLLRSEQCTFLLQLQLSKELPVATGSVAVLIIRYKYLYDKHIIILE